MVRRGVHVDSHALWSSVAQSGIPNAWDFRDFEVSVGSLTAGTAMALQLRGASSDGTTAGTDDGQLLYVSGVSLFAAASLSQANGMEMHSGDGWVSLATLRVPDSGKYKVLFEARITTGNDVFRWKVWRGTLVTIDVEVRTAAALATVL